MNLMIIFSCYKTIRNMMIRWNKVYIVNVCFRQTYHISFTGHYNTFCLGLNIGTKMHAPSGPFISYFHSYVKTYYKVEKSDTWWLTLLTLFTSKISTISMYRKETIHYLGVRYCFDEKGKTSVRKSYLLVSTPDIPTYI